jgi:hypothetical protein
MVNMLNLIVCSYETWKKRPAESRKRRNMNRQPGHPFECTGNAGRANAMPQRVVEKRLRQMLDEMSQRACEMKLQAWQDLKDQVAAAIQSTNEYCLVRPPGIWTHLLFLHI